MENEEHVVHEIAQQFLGQKDYLIQIWGIIYTRLMARNELKAVPTTATNKKQFVCIHSHEEVSELALQMAKITLKQINKDKS